MDEQLSDTEVACACTDPFHDSNPDVPRMGCAKVAWEHPGVTTEPPLCLPCLHGCFP